MAIFGLTVPREAEVEVLDVGLVDGVVRHRGWTIEKNGGKVTSRDQSQQHPIPEDTMETLEKYIGDAQAKVTVGAELGHNKEFGCKAQAFVSVSVTCNNAELDIGAVHAIIQPLVRKLVNEDLEAMKADRDSHISAIPPPPAAPPPEATPGKVSNPPRANAKPATAKSGVRPPAFRR